MKIIAVIVFILLVDIITISLCRMAKRTDEAMERETMEYLNHPERITLRGDK